MLGYDEGRKLGLSSGKVIGAILVNIDITTLGLDIGTDLGSLYGSFDGTNDDKFEGIFII